MSAWQEFDQWVEDTFNPDTEFTPTIGEFLLSPIKLPGHLLMGPSTEDLFYFNIHMASFGAHYAWHASRVGGYAAWDTFSGWRMSQQLSRPFKVARFLASPVGAVTVGLVALTHVYATTSDKMGGFASPASSGIGLSPGSTDYGPFGRHFR